MSYSQEGRGKREHVKERHRRYFLKTPNEPLEMQKNIKTNMYKMKSILGGINKGLKTV